MYNDVMILDVYEVLLFLVVADLC